jgi:hypothetical protein
MGNTSSVCGELSPIDSKSAFVGLVRGGSNAFRQLSVITAPKAAITPTIRVQFLAIIFMCFLLRLSIFSIIS